MKAIVYRRYGSPDVLELKDVETPAIGADELLVRVRAASVNPLDWHLMRGRPYFLRTQAGLHRPTRSVLGTDLAGRVEAVGKDVTTFKPGDEVFGARDGSFAELARARPRNLVPKPPNLTFEQAAAVPVAAVTALQGLRDKGKVQPGQKVLIIGAAGGVGTFAVQIARSFGAEVTGVCSTRNADMVCSIGADHVVDYTLDDFAEVARRYDVVLDIAGGYPLSRIRRALARQGTLVVIGGGPGRWLGGLDRTLGAVVRSRFTSQRLSGLIAVIRREDLQLLGGLLEAGTITPVIDRTYPLGETAEAVRYLEAGHARGKVVITM